MKRINLIAMIGGLFGLYMFSSFNDKKVKGKRSSTTRETHHQNNKNTSRGAVGTRNRAVGMHWLKA